MKPSTRHSVNKSSSAKSFRGSVSKTKAINLPGVCRGGYRL